MADMNVAIRTKLEENYALLSRTEKKIADYVLEHSEDVIHESTQLIAGKTGTSTATIVRFSRALGFSGMAEFKRFLRTELLDEKTRWQKQDGKAADDLYTVVKEETILYNRECVDKAGKQLDDEQVQLAVEKLYQAKHIYIVGTGGSGSSVWCAYDSFLKLGFSCTMLTDPFFQVMSVTNEKNPKDAVLLCICHSGRARDAVDIVKTAKEKGITTIGMMGLKRSPMLPYLDVPVILDINENPKFSDSMTARICELSTLSIIYAELNRKLGNRGIGEKMYSCINMKRTKH